MKLKTLLRSFIVVFVVALVILLSSGFFTELTGNVVGDMETSKVFSESFNGEIIDFKVFDLGKIVTVDTIKIQWSDNLNACWGSVSVSSDGENWFVKQSWRDVASPETFLLSALGDMRYLKFEEASCTSYTLIDAQVEGSYVETD